MSRESDAFHRIRDNARNSVQYTQDYNAPPATKIKTNYLSAVVWTSVVAAVVCTIFMGLLLYVVNESQIEERLEKAASQAIYSLETTIKTQSTEMQKLREENKKIHNYLLLWTPMDAQRRAAERCKIFEEEDDAWSKGPNILFRDYQLPQHIPQSANVCQEGNLCLPFLE
jgi:arginine utilization protein RocB